MSALDVKNLIFEEKQLYVPQLSELVEGIAFNIRFSWRFQRG